jgi:preprotein translocase subunit SecF
MSALGNIGGRLYRGEVSFDFVGRQRLWYMISGLILVISLVGLFTRGLNFTVDFKGGSVFKFPVGNSSITQVQNAVGSSPASSNAIVQQVGSGSSANWSVQTGKLPFSEQQAVQATLSRDLGVPQNQININFVGASWGSDITHKAAEALIAFLVVIVIYLSIAFEWRMAIAALVALAHDIVITIGVYALAGFEVSPATVIGLLTILGYSLYDTVVVFDKVRENTAGLLSSTRSTYSQAANLALNQTLVRSINTSVIALLPVTAILFIGLAVLGVNELTDLALVLFVGMLSGTYSSIFIATPVLADLKERQPQYKALAKRVALKAAGGRAAKRAAAKASSGPAGGATAGSGGAAAGALAGQVPPGGTDPDDLADADLTDADLTDAELAGDDQAAGPEERVPAGRAAPRPPGPGARSGPRQQPRRASSAKRRPGGKKKRR